MLRSALAVASLLALPGVAAAHIRMTDPPPRIAGKANDDAVKDAPCGASHVKGAAAQVEYTQGQQVRARFDETIDHTGCFQLAVSADDATWTVLAQKEDPANNDIPSRAVGAPRDIVANLPADFTCVNCTIQLRQVMLESVAAYPTAKCDANQDVALVPADKVYYQCSDITVVAAAVPDGGPGPSSSSSGAATSSSASGGEPAEPSSGTAGAPSSSSGRVPGTDPGSSGRGKVDDLDTGGCSSGPGGSGSALALLAVLGVTLARRRRAAQAREHDRPAC